MKCEICAVLKDIVNSIEPEQYINGAEKEVARAIISALEQHKEREHKKSEGNEIGQ